MESRYKPKLREITTFFFDIDGVFTNNIVFLSSDGEQLRTANVRDGYAVQLAVKKGLNIVILSGGKNEALRKRFEGLGVKDIFLGVGDKLPVMEKFLAEREIAPSRVCYMGDDIPDYHVMKHAGMCACPADAAPEIKSISNYISPRKGGEGCVRDILEQALKVKGLWQTDGAHVW